MNIYQAMSHSHPLLVLNLPQLQNKVGYCKMINNKRGRKDKVRGEKERDRRHKDQEIPTITNNSNGIKTFPLKRT